MANLKTKFLFTPLIVASFLFQNCFGYRVVPKGVSTTSVNADTVYKEKVLFWGLKQPMLQPDCKGNGVGRIEAKSNLGHILVGTITLGIYVPIKVSCWCAKDSQ